MSASCPDCGMLFSDSHPASGACPNCGAEIFGGQSRGPGSLGPIRGYFGRVWMILTQPTVFFRSMPVRGGVSGPLAFALITHWLGAAVGFVWRLLIGGALADYFNRMVQLAGDVAEVDNPGRNAQLAEMSERVQHWLWGAGSIIIDPFMTMLQIFFVSFLVFLGARIFVTPGKDGAPREISYESALRIVCYGMTPSILAALPLFGGTIAYLYRIAVSVIGARETYRIDTGRAALVALFPQVLLVGLLSLVFFAVAVAFLKFFAMVF